MDSLGELLLVSAVTVVLVGVSVTVLGILVELAWAVASGRGRTVDGAIVVVRRPSLVNVAYELRTDATSARLVVRGPRGCIAVAALFLGLVWLDGWPLTAPLRGEKAAISFERRDVVPLVLNVTLAVFQLALGTLRVEVFAERGAPVTCRRWRLGIERLDVEVQADDVEGLQLDVRRVVLLRAAGEPIELFAAGYLRPHVRVNLQEDLGELTAAIRRLRDSM